MKLRDMFTKAGEYYIIEDDTHMFFKMPPNISVGVECYKLAQKYNKEFVLYNKKDPHMVAYVKELEYESNCKTELGKFVWGYCAHVLLNSFLLALTFFVLM